MARACARRKLRFSSVYVAFIDHMVCITVSGERGGLKTVANGDCFRKPHLTAAAAAAAVRIAMH